MQNMTRLFRWNFYFCGTNAWHSDHSPASWLPCPHVRTEEMTWHWMTKQKSKLGQQRPCLPFVWRPSQLRKYKSRLLPCACWTEIFSTADLDCDNFRASLTVSLVFHTVAGWFFSTVTIYIEGRQTVKNHCIHTGASLYWHAHIMTSSIFIMVSIFAEAGLSVKKLRKFAPSENLLLYGNTWDKNIKSKIH